MYLWGFINYSRKAYSDALKLYQLLSDWMWHIGTAASAKFVAACICYPHEVIRTRLRQPAENGVRKYTGLIQCTRTIFREEGFRALYGGMTTHLIRVVPNAAIMFFCYEAILHRWGWLYKRIRVWRVSSSFFKKKKVYTILFQKLPIKKKSLNIKLQKFLNLVLYSYYKILVKSRFFGKSSLLAPPVLTTVAEKKGIY